jgi:hypothetical protein
MPVFARAAILAVAGCLCASVSNADSCHGPVAPTTFPEPATATEQDILSAQQSIKKYLAAMEDALKCLNAAHNDAAYNRAVEDMQKTAASFNTVVRAFRARQRET